MMRLESGNGLGEVFYASRTIEAGEILRARSVSGISALQWMMYQGCKIRRKIAMPG